MKEPQHSIAARPKLMKQLQFTPMKIFKCLGGEEAGRFLCMFRTARNVSEMPDYLIGQCSNAYLNKRHTGSLACISNLAISSSF